MPGSNPGDRARFGVAPSAAMDGGPVLPRRSLAIGATGHGAQERRYKIVANIDRGGMGELFLAELHEERERGAAMRYVVLKRLLADLLDDDKYISMFLAEADVMSKLNHPNIVRVFDTPLIDGTQCLAMEYVRGRNVQQILTRCDEIRGRMPPGFVLRVMSQILRGLEYAHAFHLSNGEPLDLVHRDVTPGNVLVSFDGEVKLTDFGIAKSQISAVSTTVGIVKGKARYLAPEQILGETATPRSDIFSAACVIVEMLTGTPVFDRGSVPKTLYAIVNGDRDDLEQVIGFRAPLLVQILNRALAIDPRGRIQSAKELAEGLDAAGRLLGRPFDPSAIGGYLRELYKDVDDPLSRFAVAPPAPAFDDQHTVRAAPRPPAPPPKAAPTSWGAPVEEEDPDVLAMMSAHSGMREPPTNVIRGTPIDPAEATDGERSVDEALSVLAWLQSQRDPESKPTERPTSLKQDAIAVVERTARPEPPGRARPKDDDQTMHLFARPYRLPLMVLYGLGVLTGIFATLTIEALMRPPILPKPHAERSEAVHVSDPVEQSATATQAEDEAPPDEEVAVAAGEEPVPAVSDEESYIDLTEPKGARIRIDGVAIKDKLPLASYAITPGRHHVQITRGRYKREVSFAIEPGEKLDLTKRLKRKSSPPHDR